MIFILPEEIIIHILRLATPDSIIRCSQVCHYLRRIVTGNSYIHYLLELDACGYVEPPRTRSDLSYAQKLDILRAHKTRWNRPGTVTPVEYELNADEHGVTYEYAGGIYIRGVPLGDYERLTRRLYFYQLPSNNRGTGYKQWCISDLGVDTRDFGICPEQDLLVLLELGTLGSDPVSERVCRIHLKTMTTNEVHPRAKPGRSVLTYHPPRNEPPPDRSFYFEISGDLLAILFRSRARTTPSYVVIWDWTTGIELTRAHTVGGWNASFTLISENAFVLPRFSRSYDTEDHVPNDTFGSLNVYQFDPHARTSSEPRHAASFVLPPLRRKNGESTIQIRCSPTVASPSSYAHLNSSPKIYDLEPRDRLLCIDIHRTPTQGAGFAESSGTLFVPSKILNASLEHNGCLTVPWSTWAPKVSWADTRTFRTGNECYMFGQRSVAFRNTPTEQTSSIVILDFDSQRLKARRMLDSAAEGEVYSPGDGSLDRIKEFTGKAAFCSAEAPAGKKYVKIELTTELEQDIDFWDTVMIDEERIVVKKIRQEGKFSLLVYNF